MSQPVNDDYSQHLSDDEASYHEDASDSVSPAEIHAVEKERKERTILLMAIPNEHLRRFHGMDDAKEIWEAIRTRFGGNTNSKKMQKAILKQQFKRDYFYQNQGAGKKKKNQNCLLTMDDGVVNWGEHTVEEEETNHALMAISSNTMQPITLNEQLTFQENEIYAKDENLKRYRRIGMKAVKEKEQLKKIVDSWKDSSKNLWKLIDSSMSSTSKVGLGYEIKSNNEVLSYEEEMNRSVFKCTEEDYINKPLYNRFTKTNSFKGVPHPLTGDYTPKPQEEIDDSLYVYGKKGPQKPEISDSDDNSTEHSTCQSNDSEGSCGNTSEHSSESESESISVPNEMSTSKSVITNEKVMSELQEVEPSCAKHVKTPRQQMKNQGTSEVKGKNWNKMMERELGEGYSFIKKKCFVCGSLSHLIKDCDYYEKKMAREAEFKKQRVFNTGNRVAKPVWTNANRVNHANQFVPKPVQLNGGRPNANSVRPNVNTGRVNVNYVRSNVNTSRTNVNPVRLTVNTGSSNDHPLKTYASVVNNSGSLINSLQNSIDFAYVKEGDKIWQTATANTLADGTLELHATIDIIMYTITEASIRNKLQLADASGITMLPNNEIFEGMGNMGVLEGTKSLFPTMLLVDTTNPMGKFTFPADFIIVDYDVDPRVSLILRRLFLRTARALVDVYGEELALRVGDEKLIFNVERTSKYPHKHGDESIIRIDIINTTCEDHFHEVLNVQKSINPLSGSPTPSSDHADSISPEIDEGIFGPKGDIILFEKLLNNDSTKDLPLKELKNDEIKTTESSIEEPPDLELKDLPPHLEYAFLEGTSKLPVIIAKT
ncbi:hypothetical protein Tco_0091304 [Tanacetum coccineum]